MITAEKKPIKRLKFFRSVSSSSSSIGALVCKWRSAPASIDIPSREPSKSARIWSFSRWAHYDKWDAERIPRQVWYELLIFIVLICGSLGIKTRIVLNITIFEEKITGILNYRHWPRSLLAWWFSMCLYFSLASATFYFQISPNAWSRELSSTWLSLCKFFSPITLIFPRIGTCVWVDGGVFGVD